MSEKEFMQQVIELATLYRWMVYHTFDSRRSCAGFPDLLLLKNAALIVAELKVGDNKPTSEQRTWLDCWRLIPGALVCVWRPTDWKAIERAITGI